MTPIVWPTLDNNGMPSWVRANRANEQAYVQKVPARTASRAGVAAASKGMPSLRRGRSYSIAILVLVAVIALRRKR